MTPPSEPVSGEPPSGALCLRQPIADQFAYHVRMAAVFAVAGQTEESASEAVLAWAMLTSQCPIAESGDDQAGPLERRVRDQQEVPGAGFGTEREAHVAADAAQLDGAVELTPFDELHGNGQAHDQFPSRTGSRPRERASAPRTAWP